MDPHIHRFSAYVASFVNSLPLVLTNPHLRPALVNTRRWRKSRSRTFRFMHALLTEFAKLATCVANVDGGVTDGPGLSHSPKFIRVLVDAVDGGGRIDLERLAEAAHSHGHKTLARVFNRSLARERERGCPLLPRVAIVRDASAAPGAQALLNQYGITEGTQLTANQVAFLFCHRLGVPLPYLRPPYACSPRCKTHIGEDLWPTMPHGFHQTQCNMSYMSTMRHNAWLDVISKQLRKWCGITSILGLHLRHSESNKRTIDAIFTDPARPEQWPMCCDNTCVNPMLPSYVRHTYSDTVRARERDKIEKHERGCRSLDRHFVAAILTPAGSMGRKTFLDWWDSTWKRASYQQVRFDCTVRDIYAAKQHAEACLHATIVRHTTLATEQLTSSGHRAERTSHNRLSGGGATHSGYPRRAVGSGRGRGRRSSRGRGRGRT